MTVDVAGEDEAATPGSGQASRSLEGLTWELGHDRASIERFVAAYESARDGLVEQIEAAKARTARARARTSTPSNAEADVRNLLVAAQRELADLDREHELIVRAIEQAAAAEEASILEAARAGGRSVGR